MATTRKLIHDWAFTADTADDTTSSDSTKITLDRVAQVLRLVPQATNVGSDRPRIEYPSDTDLTITTEVRQVPKLTGWLKIQIDTDTPKSLDRTQNTYVRLRLSNGVSAYYWDGAAWSVTTTSWNTPDEVVANIASWASPSLGFIVNLYTTDPLLTPTLSRIRALYSVFMPSYFNDLVYDTVIASIQDNVRPIAELQVESDGTSTIDLSVIDLESNFDITGVDSAFNVSDDAGYTSDILSGYDTGTQVVTLTGSPDVGDIISIQLRYAPQVSYSASQDYLEVATLPALVFQDISVVELGEAGTSDYIMDTSLSPPQAVILQAPRRVNIVFTMDALASLVADLHLLQESVVTHLHDNRTIDSAATGVAHTMRVVEQFARVGSDTTRDVQQARMTFQLENVYMWLREPIEADAASGVGFGVSAMEASFQIGHATQAMSITED
jgi:hypothetical protein